MKLKLTSNKILLSMTIALVLGFVMTAGCTEIQNIDTIYVAHLGQPDCLPLAMAEGYLEKEMGANVEIVTFDAGRDAVNVIASNEVQLGDLGNIPPTLGIINGMDIEVIWINSILGSAEALVAKKGENINSLDDLRGKKIATTFPSTVHYSLLQALNLAGISEDEVTIIDMPQASCYAAWLRGDIDAAYVWDPTLSEIMAEGDANIIIDSAQLADYGIYTADITIVNKEFAKEHPDMVLKFINAMNDAVSLYRDNEEKAINDYAAYIGWDYSTAKNSMEGRVWLSANEQLQDKYMGTSSKKGKITEMFKETSDYLYSVKSTTSNPDIDVFYQAINPSYIEQSIA